MTERSDMDLPDGGKSYKLVAEGAESTVVAEYEPSHGRETAYQSEADLEEELLRILESQGYERFSAHTESELIANLRTQLEKLNDVRFTDNEWSHFFHEVIASSTAGIEDKTRLIQEDNIQILNRDDGTTKNIRLIDKVHVHSNRLQVLHQFEEEGGSHPTRYDVTILVNGLPLVQIELKRRGVAIKEAFNQINRYQRDSFWAGSGLYEYAQIFIISNGTHTKYYSNTTRFKHIHEMEGRPAAGRSQKSSDSFEFTSWWADGRNHVIADLTGFARTFLARHTLLNILTRYCVFTAEHDLLVMRPYQIAATERILNRILISEYDPKKLGTPEAGGYVWHTTGSGKTLTSFKTAQLASNMDGVDKVLFVVDRKDLDYQTIKEYERFKKGAVNSNKSTKVLADQLASPRREDHRHHDSEAFLIYPRQSQARCLRAACGADFRRMSSQPVRRDAYRHHQAFQELSSVRVHRYSHLRRERENRWLPRPAHHRTGVRRLSALIHGGRCDQGRQRAAVPHRLRGYGAP